jgi:cyclopropane fatty-acyl-phospholipid synthase-like methyltransferase
MSEYRNVYEDEEKMRAAVDAGEHRSIIGGMWEEVGELQLEFLKSKGLEREHFLLDLGCGSGRLGVKAVSYLNSDRYYGIDLSQSLLGAARKEIEDMGLGDKISRRTFHATGDFRPQIEMPRFDFVIAQSLFTHLPLGAFGSCLHTICAYLAPGAKFYATFFVAPYNTPSLQHDRGGIITYADRDPFHHPKEAIIEQAIYRSWQARFIGEWGHPRDQQMFEFSR